MNIDVEHKDSTGQISTITVNFTWLALLKHLAIAGQGHAPALNKLMRTIGMMLHYCCYIQKNDFNNNRFSEPPKALSDPTEKAQFSNLVGKAIADYLSKKIDKSIYTVNYEAAMRLNGRKIGGSRPDLIAYCPQSIIAIEAKGLGRNTPGNMQNHKKQSQSGPIKVNRSVACVSYNIFQKIKCNYHDPVIGDFHYDNDSLKELSKSYYKGLSDYLSKGHSVVTIGGEKFYKIDVANLFLGHESFQSLYCQLFVIELLKFYNLYLLLPGDIEYLCKNGISREIKPLEYDYSENLYIDNDRVGFMFF